MADRHDDPALEARLREYLAGELRRAEDDYPRLGVVRARPTVRGRRPLAFALVAVAVLVLAGALVLPRVVGPSVGGPPAITMGDDGLPLTIDGEPVRRLDDMSLWATDRGYLMGGTLALNTGMCGSRSARAQLGCGEDWVLASGPLADPAMATTLDGAPAAPGFVRTSGALTVIRVGDPSPIDGVLTVTSIAWRQPTKGPIPENATPPEGGMTNDALVPDFVPHWAADGVTIAGYIPKRYLVGPFDPEPGTPANPPQDLPIPVYGEDLVTLVGHSVPGVGFVALGSTETPSPREFSEAPATAAPVSVAPSGGPEATAPLPATPNPGDPGPALDCGRIAPSVCARAVDLARSVDQGEITGDTSRIVVDDTCPPQSDCDRQYPFDAFVVFVTAGADTTGWITFEATGLEYNLPNAARRLAEDLPAFMANRVAASSASELVLRFDIMNRSSTSIVVSVSSDAGADMLGFLPGEQGTVYVPLRSRTSVALVELLAHPSCRFFAGASISMGYGEMLLIDDNPVGTGLTLSFDPGLFVTPQPLPVNGVHCPGG